MIEGSTLTQYLNGRIFSFVLVDSTSATVNNDPFLFSIGVEEVTVGKIEAPRFEKNLHCFGRE